VAFINNSTLRAVDRFVLLDPQGEERLLVVMAADFRADENGAMSELEPARPILLVDEHYGEPGASSVRFESEVALRKPQVDVLVVGSAHAPRGRKTPSVRVGLRAGSIRKELHVQGDRRWSWTLLGRRPSRPRPFTRMPVVYERAFGGTRRRGDRVSTLVENPVGVGYAGAESSDSAVGTRVPSIEYPSARTGSPGTRGRAAGLGVIHRSWEPRLALAGTFDDAWQEQQWPLLPLDFDDRHFQSAPEDQRADSLPFGTNIELHHMTPDGLWRFPLPGAPARVDLVYARRRESLPLRMDTVILEPEQRLCRLVWRGDVPVRRMDGPLEEVVAGDRTRGWWRARVRRRAYVTWSNGSAPQVARDE
jgi:hypothetical protein